MSFDIREARSSDYNRILELMREVHRLHLKNRPDVFEDTDLPFTEEEFKKMIENENKKMLVAYDTNGDLLGYTILQELLTPDAPVLKKRKFIHMDELCVGNEIKRQGVGKALFEAAIKFAEDRNADYLDLQVWEFNESAIRFYESVGMKTRNRKMEFGLSNRLKR